MKSKLWAGIAIIALSSVLSACAENGVGSMSRQPSSPSATVPPADNASTNNPGSPLGRE